MKSGTVFSSALHLRRHLRTLLPMIWSLNGTKPLDLFAGHFVEHRLGLVHFPCHIRTSSSIRVVGEHQLSVSIFQLGGSEGFPDGDEKVGDDFNVSQVLKYQT